MGVQPMVFLRGNYPVITLRYEKPLIVAPFSNEAVIFELYLKIHKRNCQLYTPNHFDNSRV